MYRACYIHLTRFSWPLCGGGTSLENYYGVLAGGCAVNHAFAGENCRVRRHAHGRAHGGGMKACWLELIRPDGVIAEMGGGRERVWSVYSHVEGRHHTSAILIFTF